MSTRLALLLSIGLVSACAPLSIYHKPGVDVATWRQQTTRCEVQALQQAPVAMETRQEPDRYIPPRTFCNDAGECVTEGGYWIPGRFYQVDVNAGLRKRVEAQCMAARGYQPVNIPRCPPGTQVSGATQVLPPLSAASCIVPLEGGRFAIVTRG